MIAIPRLVLQTLLLTLALPDCLSVYRADLEGWGKIELRQRSGPDPILRT